LEIRVLWSRHLTHDPISIGVLRHNNAFTKVATVNTDTELIIFLHLHQHTDGSSTYGQTTNFDVTGDSTTWQFGTLNVVTTKVRATLFHHFEYKIV